MQSQAGVDLLVQALRVPGQLQFALKQLKTNVNRCKAELAMPC